MKILLTNDDGFTARGITTMEKVLSAEHDVYVIAPDDERSGSSNAFTIREPLTLTNRGERRFSLSGYPTDCANVGIKAGIIPKVDIIVSGINHGANIGDDTFFSGTVGAARMAYISGYTGIAVSLASLDPASPHFRDAALFVLSFIKDFLLTDNTVRLFNINYPNLPPEKIKGMRYAPLARRNYGDSFKVTPLPDGRTRLQFVGETEQLHTIKSEHETDADLLKLGYITVTPLLTDCCDYEYAGFRTQKERNG
ncbi:MAG: 5'/3'-nucleotidase SurE [Leptospirales bacterium]|nr:5'/3'-nucleotidase SurE [Leptospirales bacterium]